MALRKYVTVAIVEDVSVSVEDILDGMDEADLGELRAEIDERLAEKKVSPSVLDALTLAIHAHHLAHPGPIWMCSDPICAGYTDLAVA